MRLGAQSLQSEEGVTFSPRAQYTYKCSNCTRETALVFAEEAEVPETWECKYCGHEAVLLVDSQPVDVELSTEKQGRSHWDMLLERRSRAELEELLEQRLTYLRSRRGEQKIGA
jgi:DNA-directed RNA polymerase subunit RPC12/RpoP